MLTFGCDISMQCAPLWNILNIYKKWMGTKLTICAVARSNQNGQSLWELQWVGLAPQAIPCKNCGNSLVWMLHFNAVRAPLKHSEYLQGMNGHQLTICAAARSNQNGQSLWGLWWVDHAPQAFPLKIAGTVWYSMHMNVWVQYFNAARAPLKDPEYLQGMNWDQLTICAAAHARSNQNGQSL